MNFSLPTGESCFLGIGQILITREPKLCITLLGSCIAVTLYHRPTKWAATCHALRTRHSGSPDGQTKFVDDALRIMIDAYRAAGIADRSLQAKLFGGASVLKPTSPTTSDTGQLNCERAREILDHNRIQLCQVEIGGPKGRKLWFHTSTGETRFEYLGYQKRKFESQEGQT
jgi:chemotaxis protein CheD